MHPNVLASAPVPLPLAAGGGWYVLIGLLLVVGLVIFLVILRYLGLWVRCIMTKAGIGLIDLIGMSLRKVSPNVIVGTKIMAVQAGIPVQTRDLESHYLAGGNAPKVVKALIAADRANIELDFKTGAPNPDLGRPTVDAVAKDGIQVKAKARVTVRANLERLVGGATEETIVARVGEGIVTTIGSAQSYKTVLENPDSISKRVLEKGLDAGTAFEILSIPTSTSAKTSAPNSNWTRPSPTGACSWPRPKNAAPPPPLANRRWSPWSRKTGPRSSWPRPRSPRPWPRPSAPATSASWTTTA